ncbi:MAG: universal stress protein [Polaromonas sp.]|nr:universal stress protein [Polaromonas sp.]
MFKHILIPTDGSELSNIAVFNGVTFAKEINAKITGMTVTAPYHHIAYEISQLSATQEQHVKDMKVLADNNLSVLKEAAENAGVECSMVHSSSEHPYEEIVKTAQERGCDVIFQASHGRRGMRALIMGGETHKVLTHTKIPVLVFR